MQHRATCRESVSSPQWSGERVARLEARQKNGRVAEVNVSGLLLRKSAFDNGVGRA